MRFIDWSISFFDKWGSKFWNKCLTKSYKCGFVHKHLRNFSWCPSIFYDCTYEPGTGNGVFAVWKTNSFERIFQTTSNYIFARTWVRRCLMWQFTNVIRAKVKPASYSMCECDVVPVGGVWGGVVMCRVCVWTVQLPETRRGLALSKDTNCETRARKHDNNGLLSC